MGILKRLFPPARKLPVKLRFSVQMAFFDRSIIKTRWHTFNRDPINRAGALVRKIARDSIRRRKKAPPSPPGTPPFSRQPGSLPPFKMIYYVPYRMNTAVIVGMVGFHRTSDLPPPGLQEHGGTAPRTILIRYARRTKKGKFTSPGRFSRKVIAKYPKRPFMLPALGKAKTKLASLWQNSLR